MEGWRAYCRFYLGDSHADTTSANIGVSASAAPVYRAPVYNTWGYIDYEPDYIVIDGVRIYSDGSIGF